MNIYQVRLDKEAVSLAIRGDIDVDRFDDFAEPLAVALD